MHCVPRLEDSAGTRVMARYLPVCLPVGSMPRAEPPIPCVSCLFSRLLSSSGSVPSSSPQRKEAFFLSVCGWAQTSRPLILQPEGFIQTSRLAASAAAVTRALLLSHGRVGCVFLCGSWWSPLCALLVFTRCLVRTCSPSLIWKLFPSGPRKVFSNYLVLDFLPSVMSV